MKRALRIFPLLLLAASAAQAFSPGDKVLVHLKDGSQRSGVLVEMTIGQLTIDSGGARATWDTSDVERVEYRSDRSRSAAPAPTPTAPPPDKTPAPGAPTIVPPNNPPPQGSDPEVQISHPDASMVSGGVVQITPEEDANADR